MARFQSEVAPLKGRPVSVGGGSRHSHNEDAVSEFSDLTSALPVIGRFLNDNTLSLSWKNFDTFWNQGQNLY